MNAQKWNWKTRQYEPYELPAGNIKILCDNMEEVINCASCGSELEYGESYTSIEIHTNTGFGYPVCEKCYSQEWARRRECREVNNE